MNVVWDLFVMLKDLLFVNFLKETILDSVNIHERNIQILLTKIFKVKNETAPEIMTSIFKFKGNSYDLRKSNCL